MPDLWPDFSKVEIEENHALGIIQEQARMLNKKTNGKVKATFSKTQYKKVPINPDLEWADNLPELLFGYETVEVFEKELKNKKNVNALFSSEEYKFEIYNDTYRFRLFKMDYNYSYPVTIYLDQDIAREQNREATLTVKSDHELKQLLALTFTSKKLVTIITHIMQNNMEVEIDDEVIQNLKQFKQDLSNRNQQSKELQS